MRKKSLRKEKKKIVEEVQTHKNRSVEVVFKMYLVASCCIEIICIIREFSLNVLCFSVSSLVSSLLCKQYHVRSQLGNKLGLITN